MRKSGLVEKAGEMFLVITSLGRQSSKTAFMEGIHLELKLYFSKAKLYFSKAKL